MTDEAWKAWCGGAEDDTMVDGDSVCAECQEPADDCVCDELDEDMLAFVRGHMPPDKVPQAVHKPEKPHNLLQRLWRRVFG